MKKIYFACSIRGGRNDSKLYAQIVDSIKQHARVLTEIFADGQLTAQGMDKPVKEIWKSDMAWVTEADAIEEAILSALAQGYRTADICSPGESPVSTSAMGGIIVEQI